MRNICISPSQLKFFTKRLNDDEREELMTCLIPLDSGFQIHWVAESIEKRRAYSDSRRDNRKKKDKKICITYDPHMENENEDEIKDIKEVINDLNTKANKSFKSSSQKTRTLIRARMNEGFTVADFKTVHDRKCAEWLNDDDWSKYLKPDTLYSNKFEGYLNQPNLAETDRDLSQY
jgi:uncharacterized phage protein (TIGR02220 family)